MTRIRSRSTLGVILAILAVGAGCKAARWREKREVDGAETSPAMPKQLASADVTAAAGAQSLEIDERTGRPKVDIVLRLDYFPEPRPGATNLPACYSAFPPDFELGVAVCDGRPEQKATVLARNVEQDCYTDPGDERVHTEIPLSLPGCKRALLVAHTFEPALRLDLEVRDVN